LLHEVQARGDEEGREPEPRRELDANARERPRTLAVRGEQPAASAIAADSSA